MSERQTAAGPRTKADERIAPEVRTSAVRALQTFDEQFSGSEPLKRFFRIVLRTLAEDTGGVPKPVRHTLTSKQAHPPVRYVINYDRFLDAACRVGVPATAIEDLAEQNVLSRSEIDALIVPRRTLNHRRAKHEPLNQTESERALRVARLMALAEEVFADPEKARKWLRRETRPFGRRTPLEMMETEHGARIVEELLHGIAHGIAA
jgi:putative toxin-antitoxin system antitoxin component (TIGR02293 family)